MTHRERFYAVLHGEQADRIPFIARIELWFASALASGRLPEKYRGMTMWEFMREMGFGLYGRAARVFSRRLAGVEIRQHQDGDVLQTEYHTPVGVVKKTERTLENLRDAGAQRYIVEHPFKTEADYEILVWIFENIAFEPVSGEWEAQEREIGGDGISRANASPCPVREIMLNWMGDERAIYEFHDHPGKMERLIETLTMSYRRMHEIVLNSPADIVLTGANFTTATTPPPLFRKHFLPYFVEFNSKLIERGKIPMAHTDGELRGLLPLIAESRFRIADAFTPAPMTSVTVREALDAWGDDVMVFGGIPSLMLSPTVSDAEFESYVIGLLHSIRRCDRFVLGIGDTTPPEADFERILLMSRIYAEYGGYSE